VLGRILTWLGANRALAIILAGGLLVGAATVAVVIDADGPSGPVAPTTITVNAAAGDGQPSATITVPTPAVEQARDSTERGLQVAPAGTPRLQLDAAGEQAASIRATEKPLPTAGASQGFAGCVTRFVVNQSSRNGVRPQVQVLHYTVSPNRPGWSDVNAIVAMFNTPSFQASSNFVIDGEGNCAYIVPIEAKAWTQAAGNPFAISYEVINTGSESVYMAPAGLAKLRLVVQEVARRTGIPLRRGAVSNCTVTVTGIVQHSDFGICGGGHGDIGPFALAPVIDYVARPDVPPTPLTRHEQRIVRGVTIPKGTGHSRRYWCDRDAVQRQGIKRVARAGAGGWGKLHRAQRYQMLAKPFAKACR
jgi:N-acetylmuramoyl-L-alanine amidase